MPGDIEIEIVRETLTDRYLISPNELHRGEGPYAGLSGDARCLLAAFLTMQDHYRTNKARVARILPDLGETSLERVVRTLRLRGFLSCSRRNDPDNRGRFRWQWRVFMSPLPDSERDDLTSRHKTAGGTMPQIEGYGETAGGTMPQSPSDGRPRHGPPRRGPRGSAPYTEKDQGKKPPTPRRAGEPDSSGDEGQQPDPASAGRCEHGLLSCRACGTTPRQRQRQAEQEREAARAPCRQHRGEWADTCGRCRADLLAVDDGDDLPGERMDAADARRLAREAVKRSA